jgi:hypothetical protein
MMVYLKKPFRENELKEIIQNALINQMNNKIFEFYIYLIYLFLVYSNMNVVFIANLNQVL